ncbi:hypothetical protein [Plantactinospora sonchi]|uniref:Uncharacterized protein n=1 Tax=Plantactinospora sonchi TaxID=1544735 RepID=A0ABU7RVZ6_9ACTN
MYGTVGFARPAGFLLQGPTAVSLAAGSLAALLIQPGRLAALLIQPGRLDTGARG